MLLNVVTVGHEGREKDSPPTNVARVQMSASTSVGSLHRSERFFRFPASLPKPTLLN